MTRIAYTTETVTVTSRGKTRSFPLDGTLTVIASVRLTSTDNRIHLSFRHKGEAPMEVDMPVLNLYDGGFSPFFDAYLRPLSESQADLIYEDSLRQVIDGKTMKPEKSRQLWKYLLTAGILDLVLIGLILLQVFRPLSKTKTLQATDIVMIVILGIIAISIPMLLLYSYRKKNK